MLRENEFFFIPNCFQIPYLIKVYNIIYAGKNLTRLTNYEKVGEFIQRSTYDTYENSAEIERTV